MRRGLMAWDPDEVPARALDERLARLRAEMRRDGVEAFVAYTNIARGGAVCWLTGFTPYWNEGLLYVPMQGEPVFATALSKRVAEWIGSVMPVGQVTTTPRPSVLIGERIAQDGAKRVGILELDDFPAGHAQAILQAAPGVALVDATESFARARSTTDAVEHLLVTKADALAAKACAALDPGNKHARDFIAPAEIGRAPRRCRGMLCARCRRSRPQQRVSAHRILGNARRQFRGAPLARLQGRLDASHAKLRPGERRAEFVRAGRSGTCGICAACGRAAWRRGRTAFFFGGTYRGLGCGTTARLLSARVGRGSRQRAAGAGAGHAVCAQCGDRGRRQALARRAHDRIVIGPTPRSGGRLSKAGSGSTKLRQRLCEPSAQIEVRTSHVSGNADLRRQYSITPPRASFRLAARYENAWKFRPRRLRPPESASAMHWVPAARRSCIFRTRAPLTFGRSHPARLAVASAPAMPPIGAAGMERERSPLARDLGGA